MDEQTYGIFISYRRDDSADVSGRIYDHLVLAFGQEMVFKDVDAIPLGVDFRQHLDEVISRASVALVVIGRHWADATDAEGQRRLDSSTDFVRFEIAAALARGIPVIPLLVQGAMMPKAGELPDGIQDLAFRHGTTIKQDPDFRADIERLIKGLRAHLGPTRQEAVSVQRQSAEQTKPSKRGRKRKRRTLTVPADVVPDETPVTQSAACNLDHERAYTRRSAPPIFTDEDLAEIYGDQSELPEAEPTVREPIEVDIGITAEELASDDDDFL